MQKLYSLYGFIEIHGMISLEINFRGVEVWIIVQLKQKISILKIQNMLKKVGENK